MKRNLTLLFLLVLVLGAVSTANAQWYSGGQKNFTGVKTNKLRVGQSGTQFDHLATGYVYVNNGVTSGSVTVTNALPTDVAILTPLESLGSATKFSCTVTTNTIRAVVDQDPGTTVSFGYILLSPNYTDGAVYGLR